MAEVILKNVCKEYGRGVRILESINLQIPTNKLTVFVGPSGCGKSTLLKLIAGLEDISGGNVLIDGQDVTGHSPSQRGIAMVFQSYALYPHMSVYENMAFAMKIAKASQATIEKRVNEVAKILKLDPLLQRKPRQLSGGQRQRVAIGRALVREPKVFLLDEPLSNLDAALRVDMRLEIAKIRRTLGATMIYVTHDQVEAMTLADQIVVLNAGRIEQVGAPLEIYHKPVNRFVAGFLGSPAMNFLKVKLTDYSAEKQEAKVAIEGQSGELKVKACIPDTVGRGAELTLGIRPEHLEANRDLQAGPVEGIMDVLENLGDHSVLYTEIAGGPCVVKITSDFNFSRGDKVSILPKLEHAHLFGEDGVNLSLLSSKGESDVSIQEARGEARVN
jgi:multiple sugar transport system ATP-binding protein